MEKFSVLMEKALESNREKIDTLSAFQKIITEMNNLAEEYEKEEGIEYISFSYPTCADDYLLVTICLSKKGKIIKDVGTFIEAFVERTNCEYNGDVTVDADEQTKSWRFIHRGICYTYCDNVKNPRVTITVDAKKSTICKRVPTGKMVPVYEFICEEE